MLNAGATTFRYRAVCNIGVRQTRTHLEASRTDLRFADRVDVVCMLPPQKLVSALPI